MMLLGYAVASALVTLGGLILLASGWGKIKLLTATEPALPEAPLPRVSVIVPACNEAHGIRQAAQSLLALDYPDLELIMIDDRSTDGTGAILDALAAEHRPGHTTLRVLHIDHLPEGWLGKNHALWRGSQEATGEWLLFTDADVVYHPQALRRAMAYATAHGLDHLTLGPRMAVRGYWLRAFVGFFLLSFLTWQRPWLANDPNSSVSMGIGAFNLIRRQAYAAIGTHQAISLRPDDDLRLGARVKRAGLHQGFALASDLLSVEWYSRLGEAVRGLEKNTFAGMDYRLWMVLGSALTLVLSFTLPWVLLPFARGPALPVLAGTVLAQAAAYAGINSADHGWSALLLVPSIPVTAVLFAYTIVRAALLALRQGGIWWRGTHYPLDQLRQQSGLD